MLETNRVHIGDVFDLAPQLEPNSVQCIVTSPPYFGLRDYGTAKWEGGSADCDHDVRRWEGPKQTQGAQSGHAARADRLDRKECARCGAVRIDKQLGSEATPEEFVANLVAVFAALRDSLKDDGTVWLNLGDSYVSTAPGTRNAPMPKGSSKDPGQWANMRPAAPPGIAPKSLLMIPHRVALALQADGWVIRQDNVWAKVNPMPESVTDRTTRAHEYVFHIAKNPTYFCDMEAVKESVTGGTHSRGTKKSPPKSLQHEDSAAKVKNNRSFMEAVWGSVESRNLRSVWEVAGANFPDSHYATFPPDLIRPCILAGTSERGECAACGKAWVRVAESKNPSKCANVGVDMSGGAARTGNPQTSKGLHRNGGGVYSTRQTTGWRPQCACDAPTRPQVVCDPFAGSCTTWEVAHEEGRRFVGFDLDERSVGWGRQRLAKLPVGRLFA